MFDGSYRSKPRSVNLGTNRGNSSNNRKRNSNATQGSSSNISNSAVAAATAQQSQLYRNAAYGNNNSNRDSILNEAHRLRMERHQKLQQNKAAIRIQQHIRGRQLRKRLLKRLYHRIIGDDSPSTTVCATMADTDMMMKTEEINRDIHHDSLSNQYEDDILSKKLDISILLNIYFRLQPPQETLPISNHHPANMLLLHFSTHIQTHYHHLETSAFDDKLTRNAKILEIIVERSRVILSNNQNDDFVLNVHPNTFHIFKSILRLIPSLFVDQQRQRQARQLFLSANDIIIIMSYVMQLHQYPSKIYETVKQEQRRVQSVMSIESATTILQMMINSLTFMIDRADPQCNSRELNGEISLNDYEKSSLMMRMFLMSCISTFIINQPILKDSCFPILSAVLLINDHFHIDTSYDKTRSKVSRLFNYLPFIMKVLRPTPKAPISSRLVGTNTKMIELNGPSNDDFVTQMVSNLISHYRIPVLVILSHDMLDEKIVESIAAGNNNQSLNNNSTCHIDGLHRSQEQKEIMQLSLCVQFLKFLLLDTTSSDKNISIQKWTGPESHDSQSQVLFWMIQRAVRGDTYTSAGEDQRSNENDEKIMVEIMDSTILENDEDTDQHQTTSLLAHQLPPINTPMSTTTAPISSTAKKPPRRRLTKNDLQTLPMIDKKFADTVKSIDNMFEMSLLKRKNSNETLQVIVKQICDPIAWLRWGKALMSSISEASDEDFFMIDDDMEYKIVLRHGQDDYVTLLTLLLQSTTSLRKEQNALSSRFLKVLPYSSKYLSNLWKYVLRQLQITTFLERATTKDPFLAPQSFLLLDGALKGLNCSMSLFSDLFAHHLIAINDEQFVTLYTKLRQGNAEPNILVDDVIVHLRTILNELYWTKPVHASDSKLVLSPGMFQYVRSQSTNIAECIASSNVDYTPFVRARLLLTGTKLYNALYERWCRLVSFASFCDESLWWFPAIQSYTMVDNIVTRDDDIENTATERVTITRHQQQTQSEIIDQSNRNDASEPMDVDESSSDDDYETNRPTSGEESDRLAAAFSDPKMARLLGSLPQVLPFDRRVKMFDSLIRIDKLQSQDDASDVQRILNAMIRGEDGDGPGRKSVKIRRDELYEDSMDQLNHLGPKLKGRVHVSFTNQVGTDEAGIDGGGVFKEFIDDLIKDAFSVGQTTAGHNLFSATPNQTLTVNMELLSNPALLTHYEFLGRVLGKAVYESILVEAQFCLPFLNQILGKTNTIEDLKNLDAEYYTNLRKLLSMSKSEIESMCLTFELTIPTKSNVKSIELIPNGGSISVTKANVVQYVLLVSHHRLNVLTFQQTQAFLRGFRDLVPASWVRLFSAHELQKVISGDDSIQGIDVSSLKNVMQYAAGYHPSQPIIEWFWEIVDEMTADQQRKFLKFTTSCSRQPLLGFGSLEPAPCIQQIRLPDSLFDSQDDEIMIKEAPLPTSSTCMNLFKLPNYKSKEIMRRKILSAIESGSGFELT